MLCASVLPVRVGTPQIVGDRAEQWVRLGPGPAGVLLSSCDLRRQLRAPRLLGEGEGEPGRGVGASAWLCSSLGRQGKVPVWSRGSRVKYRVGQGSIQVEQRVTGRIWQPNLWDREGGA